MNKAELYQIKYFMGRNQNSILDWSFIMAFCELE